MLVKPIEAPTVCPRDALLQDFEGELLQQGYAASTVRKQKRLFAHLSDWLQTQELTAGDLSFRLVDRFLRDRRSAGFARHKTHRTLRPILDYLHRLDVYKRQILHHLGEGCDVLLNHVLRQQLADLLLVFELGQASPVGSFDRLCILIHLLWAPTDRQPWRGLVITRCTSALRTRLAVGSADAGSLFARAESTRSF